MTLTQAIPDFGLYGEDDPFPDVIHCESYQSRAPAHRWRILPHRHEQMAQLFVVDRGRVEAVVDGRKLTLTDGRFLFVPPRSVHEFDFEPGTEGNVISFPSNVLASIGPTPQEVLSALAQPFSSAMTTRLEMLVGQLQDVAASSSAFRTQQAIALAHATLAVLAEWEDPDKPDPKSTKPARLFELDRLIAERMADGWTASDYAAALSVSTGHLSRLCRAASGMGAAAYLEHRLMEEACRMLAFTQLPVSDVGYRLGYSDPSYFSKRFRRAYGASPTAYRARFMG